MRKNATVFGIGLFLGLLTLASQAATQDLIFVFDNSGSMRKADPKFAARDETRKFLAALGADTRAGVIVFDRDVKLTAPLAERADGAALAQSLDGVDYRGQLTNSPAAVERAIYELKTNGRADAQKAVVFMTDGIVDTGNKAQDADRTAWLREDLAADAAANGIRIHGIAFTEAADLLLIQSLATKTGAEYFRANSADELPAALARVREALAKAPAAPTPVVATPAPAAAPEPAAPAPAPEPAPAAMAPTSPVPGLSAEERAQLEQLSKDSGIPVEELAKELEAGEPAPVAPATPMEPPAPAAAIEPVPAVTGPALSDEERASLEQLSKETGIPVEQLMAELQSAQPGQAIVTPPPSEQAEEGTPALSLGTLGAVAGGVVVLLLGIWFISRKRTAELKNTTPIISTPAPTSAPAIPAGKPALPDAWLVDINGLSGEVPRKLSAKPLMIGRIAGSDPDYLDYYVVNKATVGRRHAVIRHKDQGYWIVDQGSVNGTFVNDDRVQGERQLRHGDRIKFHKFEFEFQFPDGANETIVGMPGEQTIVASMDQTLAASSPAALAASDTFARTAPLAAAGVGAAVAVAASADDDMFSGGLAFEETPDGDLTAADMDLSSLQQDRNDFFNADGAPASDSADLKTLALNTGSDAEPEEDFDFDEPPTQQAAAPVLASTAPRVGPADFDADASAFFDETIAPPIKNAEQGADLDILDITVARDPRMTDAESARVDEDFATATTVMPVLPLDLDAIPKMPGFDGETATVTMTQSVLGDGDDTFEDFLMSDVVENSPRPPDTPLPASGDDFGAFFEDAPPDSTGDTEPLGNLPVSDPQDNVFDVTGQIDITAQQRTMVMNVSPLEPPPNESTVVLPSSPLAKKAQDGDEPHA
jgi:hypothetical protein